MQLKASAIFMACLLLTGAGSAMASSDTSTLGQIDTCLDHIRQQKATTDDEVTLSESCPGLSISLSDPALAQMDPIIEDDTSPAQLEDVRQSLISRHPTSTAAHTLNTQNVASVLKQVYQPPKEIKPSQSLLSKALDWIGEKLRNFFKRDNWLTRNLDAENKLGKDVMSSVLNAIVVILVVLVLFIVVNEFRAASIHKLFRRRRYRRLQSDEQDLATQEALPRGLKGISTLPLNLQVPALLHYSLQVLMDKQILPRRENLTYREFLAILKEKLPESTGDFEQLINSGERVLYGKQALLAQDTDQLYARVKNIELISPKVKA